MSYRIPEGTKELFDENRKICQDLENLASIIQNPGITVSDADIRNFSDRLFCLHRSFREWEEKVLECIHSKPESDSTHIKADYSSQRDKTVVDRVTELDGVTREYLRKLTGPELKKAVGEDMKLLESASIRSPSALKDLAEKKGKIIIISAASGAGKTTLVSHLKGEMPELGFSVSATTRRPRPGEVDGRDYRFLKTEEFVKMANRGEFAEWNYVHGNFYGTPRTFLEETVAAGRNVVLIQDVYGKAEFDRQYPENVGIFISVDLSELERRLLGRGTESEDLNRARLRTARNEIDFAQKEGQYDYVLVNDDLERSKVKLVSTIRHIIG